MINKEENNYLQNRMLYYNIFTKKIVQNDNKKEKTEEEIEKYFEMNKFFDARFEQNMFKGFLIDYEFLFLKKNFIKIFKEQKSNPFSFILDVPKLNEEDDGMLTSTLFDLDNSSSSTSNTVISTSCIIKEEAIPFSIPLLFDYFILIAMK